jgi:peroxin-3
LGLTFSSDRKWLQYLLPPLDQESFVLETSGMTVPGEEHIASPSLRRLVDETSDLIDSPPFAHVLTLLLDAAFEVLIDNKVASLAYKVPQTSASLSRIQEIVGTDAKAKIANTLAVFCRQAHNIGSSNEGNEYLAAMSNVRDLEAFAAVVYSSNFEYEAPDFTSYPAGGPERASSSRLGTSTLPTPAGPGIGKAVDRPDDPLPPGLEGEASLIGGVDLEKAWQDAVARGEAKDMN